MSSAHHAHAHNEHEKETNTNTHATNTHAIHGLRVVFVCCSQHLPAHSHRSCASAQTPGATELYPSGRHLMKRHAPSLVRSWAYRQKRALWMVVLLQQTSQQVTMMNCKRLGPFVFPNCSCFFAVFSVFPWFLFC